MPYGKPRTETERRARHKSIYDDEAPQERGGHTYGLFPPIPPTLDGRRTARESKGPVRRQRERGVEKRRGEGAEPVPETFINIVNRKIEEVIQGGPGTILKDIHDKFVYLFWGANE